jgi:hypothetical protein
MRPLDLGVGPVARRRPGGGHDQPGVGIDDDLHIRREAVVAAGSTPTCRSRTGIKVPSTIHNRSVASAGRDAGSRARSRDAVSSAPPSSPTPRSSPASRVTAREQPSAWSPLAPTPGAAPSAEFLAWLDAVEAECETRCGNTCAALHLIAHAEDVLAAGSENASPAWMDWFSLEPLGVTAREAVPRHSQPVRPRAVLTGLVHQALTDIEHHCADHGARVSAKRPPVGSAGARRRRPHSAGAATGEPAVVTPAFRLANGSDVLSWKSFHLAWRYRSSPGSRPSPIRP